MTSFTDTLRDALARLRQDDPLRAVHVAVPTPTLGQALTRALAAQGGFVGVRFVLLDELAWQMAAPSLLAEGRGRVPEGADLALLLGVLRKEVAAGVPEHLRAAAELRGFAPAVLRTLRDLRAAGVAPQALEDGAESSADPARLRLLARLAVAHAAALEAAGLADRPAIWARAARSLPQPWLGAVVFCGIDDPPPAQQPLIEAICRCVPFAWIEAGGFATREVLRGPAYDGGPLRMTEGGGDDGRPLRMTEGKATEARHAARRVALLGRLGLQPEAAPARDAASSLARLQQRLFQPPTTGAAVTALDDSVRVLSAAGESLEAVEIARLLQRAAGEGVRFHEMAVLLHDGGVYLPALAAALERAGVPALFLEGVPRVDPAARALGLLLGLLEADLDRARVMELLTTAQVPFDAMLGNKAEISTQRWDYLSARAGIVQGLDSWRSRLAVARGERAERGYENDRDLRLFDSLLALVELLAADLAAFPREGGWGDFLAATQRLLERWVRQPQLTAERLTRLLEPLAQHAPAPARGEFLARVDELIASQVYREGELGEGRVFVGSITGARGLRFRLVVVPGLVEGRFPGLARPDPLLLDDERRALSPALRTVEDGVERERLLFREAVLAAGERLVLSFPRLDAQAGRDRVASSFLTRTLRAATGQRFGADELLALASGGETALGRPFPLTPDLALDRLERDLALAASSTRGAARHLLDDAPHVRRSLQAEEAARDAQLTAWDGLIDLQAQPEAAAKLAVTGRETSATTLESFGGCPYRYFLKSALKLDRWEEPERRYELEGKDAGSLYHDVLEALFVELRDAGRLPLDQPAVEWALGRLGTLLEPRLDALVAEGLVPHRALLQPLASRVRADLAELLDRERRRAATGFVPTAFEQAFEGVRLALPNGRELVLRGKMDRVDTAAGPDRVRVVDYKTGARPKNASAELDGGRALQLRVYNLALRHVYPNHRVEEAEYDYLTAKGGYKQRAAAATPESEAELAQVVADYDDLARAGVFPPLADTCEFCDFQAICGPEREARAARKRDDPRLAPLRAIREKP